MQELSLLNERLEEKIIERTKALEDSELRYRQIVENATDIIFRADAKGYIMYANQTASTRLGYSQEEIIGRNYLELIHPDWSEKVELFYKKCREEHIINSYLQFPVLTKSGETIWLAQNLQFVIHGDEIVEATAVARDVTKRQLAEEALAATQVRLSKLIANLQSGILLEDENRSIVLANELFCKQFGISTPSAELIGTQGVLAMEQAKHLSKDAGSFVKGINMLLEKKEIKVGEELQMADGRILQRDYIPIIAEGKYLGHLWQYRDVTDERQVGENLRRSEEKYRGIIENMELGLLEVSTQGTILRAYHHFCEMTGYTEQELVGQRVSEIFLPPEFFSVVKQQNIERMKGVAGVYEIQIFKKDGSRIWVMVSGAPIYDHWGNIAGTIKIHYDITRQRRLQQEIFEARLRAEEAQEAEKQFLANMSHEIRTPLNAIIGMTHLLFDTEPTAEQGDYLDVLKSAADILQSLISNVLDIAKIREGRMDVHPREFDLAGLVHAMQKIFQRKIEGRPVEVDADVDTTLNTLLVGDDLMLKQVLLNLLGNAEKFTKEGRISVTVRTVKRNDDRITLRFEVSDSGIGIPQDKIELVFQSFRQADGDVKREFGGTGLGLTIVKKLVELQGGNILVSSKEGIGTTFTFELVYSDTGKPIGNPEISAIKHRFVASKDISILIVEDNSMNRKYISTLLEKWGVSHKMAFNGLMGYEMAQQEQFDLILLDIQMPEMDGYETAISIRNSNNPNRETPLVALTASALVSSIERAIQVGMNDHLSKPFNPEQLFAIMSKHLQLTKKEVKKAPNEHSLSKKVVPTFLEIDRNYLQDIYGDDSDYALDMFLLFFQKIHHEYPLMRQHFAVKDWVALSRLAHKLKPAFPMVGLPWMEPGFSTLESETLQPNPDEVKIKTLLEEIEVNVSVGLPLVQTELEELKAQVSN
ncbi:MAG: PAS domain S-box protein [Saprospiraceae bacterium]|nr:PAS domain S-box protein [Saprospiraceae bacterium]MCF8249877.1 PAS domain S-box protein [Saprospiraceae bacterium]MCF8279453.1 PAS domain S-box protein [Bacteroidales bacterium]MCF8311689.1 PAS domain S-box protein [Saprospiraceae bacterium]